jgi:anti-anti-sigma factor
LAVIPVELQIETGQDGPGTMVISCAGDIDLASTPLLGEAIDWSYTSDLMVLRIDLTAVTFIDSSGIQCLLDASERCHRLATRFEVVVGRHVERVLRLVDVRFDAPEPAAELTRS